MKTELFNFDYNRLEIVFLSFIPALINLIIFFYSFLILDKTKITTHFAVFVLFLGLWQSSDGFMKMSRTIEAAEEWNRIGCVFVLLVIPVAIQFILSLAGWLKKYSRITAILLFFPVIIFFVFIYSKLDSYTILKSDSVYWIVNPEPTFITLTIFSWITSAHWLYFCSAGYTFLKLKRTV